MYTLLSSDSSLPSTFLNYFKERNITLHQSYNNQDIRYLDEQQNILQLCTKQLTKSTFIIRKAAGKSAIIKEIRKRITEQLGSDAIMFLALTGTAAINVQCKAIYSALKVPTCSESFADLGCQAARNLQLGMDPMSFIIIDEYSMIGCRLIAELEQ